MGGTVCLCVVTLIPEPEKGDDIVQNGVKTDKNERSGSSVDKSNLPTSTRQHSTIPTSAKKGKLSYYLLT
jgi:hypothetical protein